MSYFRIKYDGYMEGEFDSAEDAAESFIENCLQDISPTDTNLEVEEWDDTNGSWEESP